MYNSEGTSSKGSTHFYPASRSEFVNGFMGLEAWNSDQIKETDKYIFQVTISPPIFHIHT